MNQMFLVPLHAHHIHTHTHTIRLRSSNEQGDDNNDDDDAADDIVGLMIADDYDNDDNINVNSETPPCTKILRADL